MSLEYRIERDGDVVTVTPEGDIGVETVDVFREVLRSVVDTRRGGDIDIDMRFVTFLDSTGIGVLIAAKRAASSRGTRLMLSRPGPIVRMVLEMAHLDEVLVRATTEA
jgi:anti-sigma B factor antagonist